MNRQFWKFYLIITGAVWLFYAFTLPVYFYFVFEWGWDEVIKWWITGTPVEFFLAVPLAYYLDKVTPFAKRKCGMPTCKECGR